MQNRDDSPSVDGNAYAQNAVDDDEAMKTDTALAPGNELPSSQRLRALMREKYGAEAMARRNMNEAATLRSQLHDTSRPQSFAAPEDYTRAVAENAARETGAGILSRQAEEAQRYAQAVMDQAWAEATAEFRRKVPDFEDVAHNPDLAVTPIMADAIRESAKGAEIAYWLGKNPPEAAKIAQLPPISQAMAIARLEGRIESGVPAVSQAPAPFSTLSGRGGSGGKRLEDMSFDEYKQARGF